MVNRLSPASFGLGWDLIDPTITSAAQAEPLRQILQLAMHDWALDTQLDVEDPATERLLATHRISTLVPTRNVLAHQRDAHRARLATIYGVQMRVESAAADVLGLLTDAGIETRVLKGLASAELDYPARSLRQTGDVDLALRLDQLAEAVQLLKVYGYREREMSDMHFLKKGTTLDAPSGVEIDLHTRLFVRSRVNVDLFAESGQALTDLPNRAFCPEHRLVHAAGHLILTPPGFRRMSGLVDITRIRVRHCVDLEESRRFAAHCGVEALVGAALQIEAQLSGQDNQIAQLMSWRQPDWLDRSTRLSPQRRLLLDQLVRVRQVPRKDRIRYLPMWLWPTPRQRQLFVRSVRSSGAETAAAARARFGLGGD